MQSFRRLSVWRKSHALALRVCRETDAVTHRYPSLGAELTRVAVRMPGSIAQGASAATREGFAQSLQRAVGDARALDACLQLAVDLDVLPRRVHAVLEARTDEVVRMLVGLRRTVLQVPRRPRTPPV